MEEPPEYESKYSQESSTSNDSGWWSSWLNSAKEKSVSALNATKRDIAEFVSVIGNDTKAAVSGASKNIKGIIEGQESTKNDSSTTKVAPKVAEPPSAPYDRSQAQLFAVQNSADTYLKEPNGDKFVAWSSGFSAQTYQTDISSLLVSCPHIRTIHSQMVPARVSYETFWMRYFYQVQLLEQEEKLRAELMARASKPSEQQLKWDEEFEEVGADNLLKPDATGHERSESSSDSFVCVSESATNDGERGVSQDPLDQETWEVVDGGSPPQSQSSPKQASEDFDIDDLLEDDAAAVEGSSSEADADNDKTLEDSNSDWEKWND